MFFIVSYKNFLQLETRKIKIVHFVEELGLGCTAKTAVNLCIGLKNLEYDIELWSLKGGNRCKELIGNGVIFKLYSKDQILDIDKSSVDIFHIHSSGLPDVWINEVLKRFSSKTKIVQTNIFGGYCDKSHDLIDLKLFVSETTLLKYKLFGGALNKNFEVLYNPVYEEKEITKHTKTKSKFVIGRIARPDVLKWDFDFELLLKLIKDSNIDFLLKIVGVPEEVKPSLEALNIDIQFIDKIESKNDLDSFYSSIDVLLHLSSIGESFGCVFVEAFSFGIPVIVKSTPITRFKFWRDNAQIEIVDNNLSGYVCNNLLSMRDALLLLINNPLSTTNIITNAKDRFDQVKICEKLVTHYDGLLLGKHISINVQDAFNRYSIRNENIFKTPILSNYHFFRYKIELITTLYHGLIKKISIICLNNFFILKYILVYIFSTFTNYKNKFR